MTESLNNLLPKHNIRSCGTALKRLRRDLADSYRPSINTRPHILRVPMRDRFELTDFVAQLLGGFGLGQSMRVVCSDSELRKYMLEDTHPDAIVVMHENIGRWLQDEHVRRYGTNHAIRPKFELVITSRDPGDLMRQGLWTPDFRRLFTRTFEWPATGTRERDWIGIFQNALGVLGKRKHEPYGLERSGHERLRTAYNKDHPESVKDIVRLAERCVKLALKNETRVITGEMIDECRARPRDSFPAGEVILGNTGTE